MDVLIENKSPGHYEFHLPGGPPAAFIVMSARFSWESLGSADNPQDTTILLVSQLISVDGGKLVPKSWSATGSKGPAIPGSHPLIAVNGLTIRVATAFVDVTEHWNTLRASAGSEALLDWYNHLHNEGTRLRVLARTSGVPLLWFAVVPSACKAGGTIDAHIFHRPAGSTAYTFDETSADGLTNHNTDGMFAICRYLLSPMTHLLGINAKGVTVRNTAVLDRFHRNFDDLRIGGIFLNAALEDSLGRTGRHTVLFLPFHSASTQYETSADLGPLIKRALTLLWVRGEFASDLTQAPNIDSRFGMSAYSQGGDSLYKAIANNASSLSEVFCIQPNNIAGANASAALLSAARASSGLRVCFVFQEQPSAGLQTLISNLRGLGANVTVLPGGSVTDFFQLFPAAGTNDWLRYLFSEWQTPGAHPILTDQDIVQYFKANVKGRADEWPEIVHQFLLFGGQDFKLTPDPGNPAEPLKIESATFFERCLRTKS
jgi:hypothetical protein